MTDAELRDQAIAHLKKTTVGYKAWVDNVKAGKYKPKDGSTTEWGQAFRALTEIGATPPPPPPPSGVELFKGLCLYRAGDITQARDLIGSRYARCDWPSDSTMNAANAAGVEVLPIFCYAHGHAPNDHDLPSDVPGWIADAKAFVAKWNPAAVEIWNEPWGFSGNDPVGYWNLTKQALPALWAQKNDLTILVCLDKRGTTWSDRILAADTGKLLADPRVRPAVHNYSWPQNVDKTNPGSNGTFWDFDRYKYAYQDLKAHGHPNPLVWVTEYGVESDKAGEQGQADYCVAAIRKMAGSGMVERAYGFEFKTADSWSYNWLRPDGSAKPVCAAVKAL